MTKTLEWNGTWHPLAERFPMLTEDELRDMAASITERGQYVPCRMTSDGLGLDGRNRVAACALAEVEPWWEVYEGDPVAFIVEVNAERRHLTTGQRAMAIAIGLVESGQRENGRFKRGAVPGDNARSRVSGDAWRQKVQYAGVVLDHAPDLADPVLRDELALDAAWKQADEIKKGKARLLAVGGELAALVETGVIDVAEAERRADEAVRIDALPGDLAERVRNETLALEEAEIIAAENRERVAVWAKEIRAAFATLIPMKGHPIPDELAEHLSPEERQELVAFTTTRRKDGEGRSRAA